MVGDHGNEFTAVVTMISLFNGWRGAKIENIQSFRKDFKDVGTIPA